MTHIGPHPLPEMYAPNLDIEASCARCGSSCDWDECGYCHGDGFIDDDDEDPDESDLVFFSQCPSCNAHGGWQTCLASPQFCKTHPLAGREAIQRGEVEWFTVQREDGK
jgi:hypothetical protein